MTLKTYGNDAFLFHLEVTLDCWMVLGGVGMGEEDETNPRSQSGEPFQERYLRKSSGKPSSSVEKNRIKGYIGLYRGFQSFFLPDIQSQQQFSTYFIFGVVSFGFSRTLDPFGKPQSVRFKDLHFVDSSSRLANRLFSPIFGAFCGGFISKTFVSNAAKK